MERRLRFRPDIEGLRAIAIFAVLLYHAQVSWAEGGYVGVDMFFVISGFLITGLIVKELEETSRLSLKTFYGRRMKRLLPAVAVLLAAVVVASWAILSPLEQEKTAWDVVSAGFYLINWRLALEATDYFAAGLNASPVQHFWTLAVEEQFYIVWPALLAAATWRWRVRRDRPTNVRKVIGSVVLIVATSSFAYNLYLTSTDASFAYFSTFTRAWEFTIGAGLALIISQTLRYPRVLAAALGWIGVAAIVWSITNLTEETPFPGAAALIPTLGTAAIIVAGFNERPARLTQLLGVRPMRHFGRLSYSWYLWHWPILVFAAATWSDLSGFAMLAISAASYFPALLAHRWVEWPVHHHEALAKHPGRAIAVGTACTVASVVFGALLLALVPRAEVLSEQEAPGAAIVKKDDDVQEQTDADRLRPSPLDAYEDRSRMHEDGCLLPFRQTRPPRCVYGHPDSDKTVVLFGDSTAMHYFPAIEPIAEEKGWRLIGWTKAGCSPALFPRFNAALKREYEECYEWREEMIERIVDLRPDLIITAGRADAIAYVDGERLRRADSAPIVERGWVDAFRRLRRSGAKIVLLQDGPRPDRDIPTCVSENMDDLRACAFDRSAALDYVSTDRRAAGKVRGIKVVDLTPTLCNEQRCPAVIGNVIVYRQVNHFTASFMKTMTEHIARELPQL